MEVITFTAVLALCLAFLFVKDHLPAGHGGPW
jgi:hypothetical protein